MLLPEKQEVGDAGLTKNTETITTASKPWCECWKGSTRGSLIREGFGEPMTIKLEPQPKIEQLQSNLQSNLLDLKFFDENSSNAIACGPLIALESTFGQASFGLVLHVIVYLVDVTTFKYDGRKACGSRSLL